MVEEQNGRPWVYVMFVMVCICFVSVIYQDYKTNEINENEAFTIGKVIKFERVQHNYIYTYEYHVGGKWYVSTQSSKIFLKGCNGFGECLGRKFKVRYASNDPENSELLLEEEIKEKSEFN